MNDKSFVTFLEIYIDVTGFNDSTFMESWNVVQLASPPLTRVTLDRLYSGRWHPAGKSRPSVPYVSSPLYAETGLTLGHIAKAAWVDVVDCSEHAKCHGSVATSKYKASNARLVQDSRPVQMLACRKIRT